MLDDGMREFISEINAADNVDDIKSAILKNEAALLNCIHEQPGLGASERNTDRVTLGFEAIGDRFTITAPMTALNDPLNAPPGILLQEFTRLPDDEIL